MSWIRSCVAQLRRWLNPESLDTQGNCGAVALHFVYRRLGKRASLTEIWNRVRAPLDRLGPGVCCSASHLMCRDALDRGLHALGVTVKYEHALAVARKARGRKVDVIFVHASENPDWHHSSVLEGFDRDKADIFDPSSQTFRSLSPVDFHEVWGRFTNAGGRHWMLMLSSEPSESGVCEGCDEPIPPEVRCPQPSCARSIPLDPASLLGCVNRECPESTWESITCPWCGVDVEDLRSWSAWG